ncbi:MAG TPA: OmpH family outer membrane protein [Saprospiraceae bacterium]|nr:OmpH family outer membrane protein [Saprospiraceae bacterium]
MRSTFLALMLTVFSLSALQAQNFGYMNSAAFVSELQEVKTANTTLENLQKSKAQVIQNMVKSLQDKATALEQKKQQGTISPKAYETQMANLEKEQEKIVKLQETSAKELDAERNKLLDPILTKVNDAIQAVAKEKSLNYVFDTSTGILLFADEALDVTEAVKAKYATLK